jgi:hypothetical protein
MNADERRFAQAKDKEISVCLRLSALICVREMKKSAFVSVCQRSSAFEK